MAVKIRLRAQGSVNRIMYRVVVADSRSPRDGKYIEAVGWYNPLAKEDMQVEIKPDRIQYWISQGAQITDKVASLMKRAAPGVFTELRAKEVAKRTKEAKKRKSSSAPSKVVAKAAPKKAAVKAKAKVKA
jgi:small subunit ribosomal protein S16